MRRILMAVCTALTASACSFTLDSAGKPCTLDRDCAASQACHAGWCEPAAHGGGGGDTATSGDDVNTGADTTVCTTLAYRRCVSDDVHSFDSCGTDEGLAMDCNVRMTCVEPSMTDAECQCRNHWEGSACEDCPDNYDPSADCNYCLAGYDPLSNCTTCLGHRDPATACATCLLGWADRDDDCDTCVRHADANIGTSGDGRTWLSAQSTLQGAIFAAEQATRGITGNNADPETCNVWVKAGNYTPTAGSDQTRSFLMRANVNIYGGFPAAGAPSFDDRDPTNHETILTGNTGTGVVCHVVTGASDAMLSGVTITGGATGVEACSDPVTGAGVLLHDASPTLEDCRIMGNAGSGIAAGARGNGGGLAALGTSAPVLRRCVFENNTAQDGGGAIYADAGTALTIEASTFVGQHLNGGMGGSRGGGAIYLNGSATAVINEATFISNQTGSADNSRGGAIRLGSGSLTLSRCTFDGNNSPWAGAIVVEEAGTLTANDCSFTANVARSDSSAIGNGGVIYMAAGTAVFNRSVFTNNHGNAIRPKGGALYLASGVSAKFINVVMSENTASGGPFGYGGALYLETGASAAFINSTVFGNVVGSSGGTTAGGGIYVGSSDNITLLNSIVWGNIKDGGPEGLNNYPAASTDRVRSNVLQDGPMTGYSGKGNTMSDPLFVGGTPTDLHLTSDSSAKDRGTARSSSGIDADIPLTDLDGKTRPQGGAWDAGAYEL